jgi:hypothetical protein
MLLAIVNQKNKKGDRGGVAISALKIVTPCKFLLVVTTPAWQRWQSPVTNSIQDYGEGGKSNHFHL